MIVVKVDNSVRDQAFSHCLPGLDTLNQTYFAGQQTKTNYIIHVL